MRFDDSQWRKELTPVLRMMQIIAGALVTGCLTFLVIVLVVPAVGDAATDSSVLTFTAAGFACVILVVRIIAPALIVAQGRRRIVEGTWKIPVGQGSQPWNADFFERTGDAGKLAALCMTRMIVSAALLEGAAFFNLIAYMLERSPAALTVAIALILGVGLHFPTHSRLVQWIEGQLTLIELER